jgi:hypothetical protein
MFFYEHPGFLPGGWAGLNELELVDIGLVRGYHFNNSRESREAAAPQVEDGEPTLCRERKG